MAIMLRTLGIVSREVNGFLPGEYNDLAGDYIVRASDAHSWVEVYFLGDGWQVFDPTPSNLESGKGFLTRLGLYIDWLQVTWSDWVIGYDFAHQVALAQNLQRSSRNWGESARTWFGQKQEEGKRWLKSWQIRHGALGYLLPVALVLLLLALRYKVPSEVVRRVRLFLRIHAAKSGSSDPKLASKLYGELLRILARRGLLREETQTPLERAAACSSGRGIHPSLCAGAFRRRAMRYHAAGATARAGSRGFAPSSKRLQLMILDWPRGHQHRAV